MGILLTTQPLQFNIKSFMKNKSVILVVDVQFVQEQVKLKSKSLIAKYQAITGKIVLKEGSTEIKS